MSEDERAPGELAPDPRDWVRRDELLSVARYAGTLANRVRELEDQARRWSDLVATLRAFYAEEYVLDASGEPTGVWYLRRRLEAQLQVTLLDDGEPGRWLPHEGAEGAEDVEGDRDE